MERTIKYPIAYKTQIIIRNMEPSKPRWVPSILNIIGVNSLRLGGLQIKKQQNDNLYVDNAIFSQNS